MELTQASAWTSRTMPQVAVAVAHVGGGAAVSGTADGRGIDGYRRWDCGVLRWCEAVWPVASRSVGTPRRLYCVFQLLTPSESETSNCSLVLLNIQYRRVLEKSFFFSHMGKSFCRLHNQENLNVF